MDGLYYFFFHKRVYGGKKIVEKVDRPDLGSYHPCSARLSVFKGRMCRYVT